MHTRIATCLVRPEHREAFRAATLAHVRRTQQEAGVQRFELLQAAADPNQFVILIMFDDEAARARHFATEHFQQWRAAIDPLLAAPVQSRQYERLA